MSSDLFPRLREILRNQQDTQHDDDPRTTRTSSGTPEVPQVRRARTFAERLKAALAA